MATAPADCACAASSHASARLSAPTCAMMSSPPAAAIQASVIALRSATESFEPSPVVPHVKTDFTPCARRFAACAGTTDVSIAPDGVNAWKFAAQRPVMRKEAILGSMLTEGGEPRWNERGTVVWWWCGVEVCGSRNRLRVRLIITVTATGSPASRVPPAGLRPPPLKPGLAGSKPDSDECKPSSERLQVPRSSCCSSLTRRSRRRRGF